MVVHLVDSKDVQWLEGLLNAQREHQNSSAFKWPIGLRVPWVRLEWISS